MLGKLIRRRLAEAPEICVQDRWIIKQKDPQAQSRWAWQVMLQIMLDGRNAFNSLKWKSILDTLKNSFYLSSSYGFWLIWLSEELLPGLWNIKELEKDGDHGGGTQESILGPDSWDASCHTIVCYISEDLRLVRFTYDVATLGAERTVQQTIDYFLTQLLNRHGSFQPYLHKRPRSKQHYRRKPKGSCWEALTDGAVIRIMFGFFSLQKRMCSTNGGAEWPVAPWILPFHWWKEFPDL